MQVCDIATSNFTLKMEAAKSFQTLVSNHIITRRHNSDDVDLDLHHHESAKSHISTVFLCDDCYHHEIASHLLSPQIRGVIDWLLGYLAMLFA
jgi:hypothetical protein